MRWGWRLREEGFIYTVQGRGSYVVDAIGPGDELIEAKYSTGPSVPPEAEPGPAGTEAAGNLTATLLAVRDELRTLNAEVQTLKREVAELKARQDS
ncbi:hypothetical protein [Streptomyces asiaticus]|uniref:hypothetical protein n=1 Tax=Streptomyces asiaticus TaxID=114695 RepID=UPI00382691CD